MVCAMLLQKYVPEPGEAGLFYIRFPHETEGRITSLTLKFAPSVTGDGRSTLEALVRADPRAGRVPQLYLPRLAARQNHVPAAGEVVPLVFTGNHCKGSVFVNGADTITPALVRQVDRDRARHPGLPFRPYRCALFVGGGAAPGPGLHHHRSERRRVGGDPYLGRPLHAARGVCRPVHPLPCGMGDRPGQPRNRGIGRAACAPCIRNGGCNGG